MAAFLQITGKGDNDMRYFVFLLCICFLLSGCRSSGETVAMPTETKTSETAETIGITLVPSEEVEATIPKGGLSEPDGISTGFENGGSLRIAYNGNISSVRYVTSVSQLPAYPELQKYDEDYFREHGLLLVMETVSYGNSAVEIQNIRLEGETGYVTLSHVSPGDVATTVMTTWLIWAEVEQGLPEIWMVENPALPSHAERS